MRTILKRLIMRAYCLGWLRARTVVKLFSLLRLYGA